ncbi:hypothetical protein CLOP_g16380 [Closterium sp. NIES-67]|nr:hypothetical protein CLOP_g16380 [Closterium sp. NIES-67]
MGVREVARTQVLWKCHFYKCELEYLGHLFRNNRLKVDPKKVVGVQNWPVPQDVGQVRSFLGLANYFRRFLENYSTVVAPLTALTRKGNAWEWTRQCQEAFDEVKTKLTNAPVLVLPDPSKPYEVVTVASIVGIGAVLLQEGRPVAFESRKLSPVEECYTTSEQELLAVVHALRTWRCYLEGVEFVVTIDHCPNTYFSTQATPTRHQPRWAELLSGFTFDIRYRTGSTNMADPLSRQPIGAATGLDETEDKADSLGDLEASESESPLSAAPRRSLSRRHSAPPPGFPLPRLPLSASAGSGSSAGSALSPPRWLLGFFNSELLPLIQTILDSLLPGLAFSPQANANKKDTKAEAKAAVYGLSLSEQRAVENLSAKGAGAGTRRAAWETFVRTTAGGQGEFSMAAFEGLCFLSSRIMDTHASMWKDAGRRRVVHSGFLDAYDFVKPRLMTVLKDILASTGDKFRIMVTGHSLGDALATVLTYDLAQSDLKQQYGFSLSMYNFGSPRVGNHAFASRYNELVGDSWRIANDEDIVPRLRIIDYRHVATEVVLSPDLQALDQPKSSIAKTGPRMHYQPAYFLSLLKQVRFSLN